MTNLSLTYTPMSQSAEYVTYGQPIEKVTIYSEISTYDWYVNSVSGNDSNTGKSSAQAFATIAKLLTVLQAGQAVGLAKGSHWRETFAAPVGVGVDNITVGASGSGARPILDCSDVITGTWTKLGGYTNVYYKSLALATGAADPFVRVWEDDAPIAKATSLANLDATPGRYLPDSSSTNPFTLYIHTSDSSDPNSNGKVYEYNRRNYGLVATDGCSGWNISGIETRRNLAGGGSLAYGDSGTITDVICRDGTKHNLIFGEDCTLDSVQAIDAYSVSLGQTLFVYNKTSPSGLGCTLTSCSASRPNTSSLANNDVSTGFYGHSNVSGDFGTVTYNSCSVADCFYGFNGGDTTDLILNNCISSANINTAIYFPGSGVTTTINGGTWSAATTIGQPSSSNATLVISGGTFTIPNPGASRQMFIIPVGTTGVTITARNATFDNQSAPFPTTFQIYANSTTLDVQQCTWLRSANNCIAQISGTLATILNDYNSYKTGTDWYILGTGYTFAQWQALGYDTHSTAT